MGPFLPADQWVLADRKGEALGGHHQANCGVDEFLMEDGEVRAVRENETPRA